jgi:hypothetical protein
LKELRVGDLGERGREVFEEGGQGGLGFVEDYSVEEELEASALLFEDLF